MAKPLIELLKKDIFVSNQEATKSFIALKQTLVSAPILSLPNFFKQFTVETDASRKGIRIVLMQDQHHISYISKSLGAKNRSCLFIKRNY